MSLWFKVRGMMGDDPPYLAVGTEVSAKYKGAFCEAKVRKVVRSVKCKVTFKQGLGTVTVTDDHIRGTLRVGAVCEVKHPEKKEIIEATITKIQDCSQYTVVFDDGDITTLRRSALCLKSGRHFAESETLDQLPLTHPEHFGNPVIGGRKGRRSRQTQDDSSDDESLPKKGKKKEEKEADIGKVVCVELGDKKKQKDNWFPGLVVAPTAQDTVRIRVKDEYLVRSFKDGRYFTVPKKEATSFTREIGSKVDNNTLKTAVEKALQYLDRDDLPPHWDRDLLFGIAESSANSDGLDSDSSDDEPREEKDHFVAQLYKFMDDRGTPINKGPTIGTRDVDLYKLFKVVDKLGGYNRVTNHNQWKTISHKLGFGQNSSSITNLVKQAYKKFLHSFEDFYRKLGCTMVNHPRGDRSRHRSGRSLIRDRDRATPVNTLKDKDKDKQMPTTSGGGDKAEQPEGVVEKKEPEEEKKDKQEDTAKPKEVKKEKVKVKEEKVETTAREDRRNERLKTKDETQALPVSEKQKKKDEKSSKAVEVSKEKVEERDDKKVKKEEKVKDKEAKGKAAGDDSVDVETESKAKYKAKKEDKSKSASERTRSKDEERLKSAVEDRRVAEDRNKLAEEKVKSEERKPVEEKGKLSEGKAKLTEAKKKVVEARSKKAAEEKGKHPDSKKSPELNTKEPPKSKTETKGKVADDRGKAPDSKQKTPEDRAKVSEPKTRGSEEKSKPQDEKSNPADSKTKGSEEKKVGEDEAKQPEVKAKALEPKPKDTKAEPKSKPVEPKSEEKVKGGDDKQKLPAEDLDSSSEKDSSSDKRADGDKQFTRSRSKEDQRLKKEQPGVSLEQRSRNRESKTPVRETAEKKPPPRKKEEMVFVLKKRGRKRKDTETKIEEGLGQIANNVNIDIGDKLKVYYGPTQESKVTYEAKVLDIEEDGLDRMYLVHYTGWNTRYDEWIKRSRIADSLSWSPSRAKRLRQQEAQLKASKQSCGRRGRPSRDSVLPPRPRSATPSSVTSSSSRTKSPAGSNHGKNHGGGGSSRGGRGRALFRRRTRRTSGHTDISLASESDTEDFESEVEVEAEPEVELSRLRSGNEKRISAAEKDDSPKEGLAKDDDGKDDKALRQKALSKKEEVSSSSTQEEEEDTEAQDDYKDESTELDTSSEVLVFETRRSTRSRRSCTGGLYEKKEPGSKHYVAKSETGTESDEEQPKGRDFDLNEIRSELKGIEKAVKVPQKADVKREDSPEGVKAFETVDPFPTKAETSLSLAFKPSVKEEEVVEDVYEFKEPEPFEFEVRPKKDYEDRSPKVSRRHVGRVFDDHVVEKDMVPQCEGKPLKRGACQLFDSDEMSEDRTDSDNTESEVKTKFVKRFALSVFDDVEEKGSKFDLDEIVGGVEAKECHGYASDGSKFLEETRETEKVRLIGGNVGETAQLKDIISVAHAADPSSFGKKSPKGALTDEVRLKSGQDSLIFEDLKYVTRNEKKELQGPSERPAATSEKSVGGIFEDEMCTTVVGQPDNELVIECDDRDPRFPAAVKLFQDEEMKTEAVLAEVVVADRPASQQVFEGSVLCEGSTSDSKLGNVSKIPGTHREFAGREECLAPVKSQPGPKEKSNTSAKKSGKKFQDRGKTPRKKFVRDPDAKTPEKKVRRSGGKKFVEEPVTPSRSRPLSACEEAFDKLCESPSFRLVSSSSKRSPTPATELEPLNIFAENTQEEEDEEEDRLIIPDDMGIGEPLFSYPRELFPALVEPHKKVDSTTSSATPGEFPFSDNEKDTRHQTLEEAQSDKVTRKLDFGLAVEGTDKVTGDVEVGTEPDAKVPAKDDCTLKEGIKAKEPEDHAVTATTVEPAQQQVTQQPILNMMETDIFSKRLNKREAAPLPAPPPVRFSGTDSSDTDSSDEGPRLVIAPPEEEEFSQLTPSQEGEEEELQEETVVDEISTASEIVLEEIKVVGPLVAEVEESQIQQEVEVEVVDESQDRVKLTDEEEEEEESVAEELETVVPIVVKVDLSSAEKVETSESEQGPVVELKISEEETTVCVVETSEAAECEVLGSLLCQETIPGSPAAAPQPAAEETAAAAPAVEMPFASAPGSSPGPRPPPEPAPAPAAAAAVTPPAPGNSSGAGKGHAAPVLDNTPPTTPDSSVSTLSDERGGMSPTLDNESSKSHRDSFEIDLDSCADGAKADHFSEDDSLVNVEVSCSSDTRLRTQKPSSAKEPLPKKRRRSRRRSEGEPNKRSRQSAGRSPRSSAHNGCASDSDDMSESSTAGCVLENSLSSRSPRPSKYNFYVELDPELDCSQRIALLQQKLQELRKTYMNIKAELACIDRRRKKLRRREREEKATKQEVTCS